MYVYMYTYIYVCVCAGHDIEQHIHCYLYLLLTFLIQFINTNQFQDPISNCQKIINPSFCRPKWTDTPYIDRHRYKNAYIHTFIVVNVCVC